MMVVTTILGAQKKIFSLDQLEFFLKNTTNQTLTFISARAILQPMVENVN